MRLLIVIKPILISICMTSARNIVGEPDLIPYDGTGEGENEEIPYEIGQPEDGNEMPYEPEEINEAEIGEEYAGGLNGFPDEHNEGDDETEDSGARHLDAGKPHGSV